MAECNGEYLGNITEEEIKFYEFGAHFKYKALYQKLEELKKTNCNEKTKSVKISAINFNQSRNINKKYDKSENSNIFSLNSNINKTTFKKPIAISSLTIISNPKKIHSNKHKNDIKKPVKTSSKIHLNNNKAVKSTNIRPASSVSNSKSKNLKGPVLTKDSQRKQRLTASYQKTNNKSSPSLPKKPEQNNISIKIDNNLISNIKYKKFQKQKSSPPQKPISKSNPNLIVHVPKKNFQIFNVGSAKSRNIKQKENPKKEENNNLTYHKNEKKNQEVLKQKPHSQEKPTTTLKNKKSTTFQKEIFKVKVQPKKIEKSAKELTQKRKPSTSHPKLELKIKIPKNEKSISKPVSKPKKTLNNITSISVSCNLQSKIPSRNKKNMISNVKNTINKNKIISSSLNHKQTDSSKLKTKSNSSVSNGSKKNGNIKQLCSNVNNMNNTFHGHKKVKNL